MESLGGMAKASSGQFNNNGSACYLEYPVSKMGQNATEEMRKQHLEELKVREEMADNRPGGFRS